MRNVMRLHELKQFRKSSFLSPREEDELNHLEETFKLLIMARVLQERYVENVLTKNRSYCRF